MFSSETFDDICKIRWDKNRTVEEVGNRKTFTFPYWENSRSYDKVLKMHICTKNFYHALLVWLGIACTKLKSNPTEVESTADSAELNGVNFRFTLENAILCLWDWFVYFRHHVSRCLFLYTVYLKTDPKLGTASCQKGEVGTVHGTRKCRIWVPLYWDKSPGWGRTPFFPPVRPYSGYWKTSHLLHEVYGRIGSMGAKTHIRSVRKKSH